MEERIGWQGQNESQIEGEEKISGKLVGAAETSKERAEWPWLHRKNLNKLGLLKRKAWSQCHRESSRQICPSRPCQKEKKQNRQSRVPDRVVERLKVGESRTLAREESEQEHAEERVDYLKWERRLGDKEPTRKMKK